MSRRAAPVLVLGAGAAVATAWYLSSDYPALVPNLAVALLVLYLPIVFWLKAEECARIALAWTIGGLAGAYFFGVFVLLAGILAAVVLTTHRFMQRPPVA